MSSNKDSREKSHHHIPTLTPSDHVFLASATRTQRLSSATVTVPPRVELDKRPPAKPPAVLRVTGAGRKRAQEMGKGRGREKGKGLLLSAAGSA